MSLCIDNVQTHNLQVKVANAAIAIKRKFRREHSRAEANTNEPPGFVTKRVRNPDDRFCHQQLQRSTVYPGTDHQHYR